jgi:GH35 family endo-1,4-beta-xylanase
MIPLKVQILARFIPILKWDNMINLSKGEIEQFKFIASQKKKFNFREQIVMNRDGFNLIWQHISADWFKLVGKSHEQKC